LGCSTNEQTQEFTRYPSLVSGTDIKTSLKIVETSGGNEAGFQLVYDGAVNRFSLLSSGAVNPTFASDTDFTVPALTAERNSGNVGIGVAGAVNKLDVEGSVAIGASYSGASTAPTDGLIVAGNVGIGTTNPAAAKLNVEISGTTPSLKLEHNGSNFIVRPNTSGGTSTIVENSAGALIVNPSGGNVGIGTASPGNKLQVNARSTGYYHPTMSSSAASMFGTSTNTADLDLGSHGAILGLYNNNPFALGRGGSLALGGRSQDFGGGEHMMTYGRISGVQRPDNNAYYGHLVFETHNSGGMYERMRIDHNGSVGIGTSSPSAPLEVNGVIRFTATGDATKYGSLYHSGAGGNLHIDTVGTGRIYLNWGGGAGGGVSVGNGAANYGPVYASAFTVSSDRRLKTDIVPIDDALRRLMQLDGYYFSYLSDTSRRLHVGLMAQDVQTVYPEVIYTDDKGYMGVNYSGLVGPTIAAVKELKAEKDSEIEDLRSANRQLKDELAEIRGILCSLYPQISSCAPAADPSH
jgi:hypothetical protein